MVVPILLHSMMESAYWMRDVNPGIKALGIKAECRNNQTGVYRYIDMFNCT